MACSTTQREATPKKCAVQDLDINSADDLLTALEAEADLVDSRASKAEAAADMEDRGRPMAAETTEDNDQQLAMALILKKYIKGLINAGAITGDASSIF